MGRGDDNDDDYKDAGRGNPPLRPGAMAEAGAGGSHVLHVESARQMSTLSQFSAAPQPRPTIRVTFSEVVDDSSSAQATSYRMRRNNSFQLRIGGPDVGQPPSLADISRNTSMISQRSGTSQRSNTSMRSTMSQKVVFPELPVRSTTIVEEGEVVIVSGKQAQREIKAFTRQCAEQCRDGGLPWRERLLALARLLFCSFDFPKSSTVARFISYFMIATILANAANAIVGSMPEFNDHPATCPDPVCDPGKPGAVCTQMVCAPVERPAILIINAVTVAIFTVDYLVRLCTAHTVPAGVLLARDVAIDLEGNLVDVSSVVKGNAWRKTWHFVCSLTSIVDLVSIVPFYLNIFIFYPHDSLRTADPGTYDVVQFFRMVRVLKLLRYSKQATLFKRTLQASYFALRFFVVMSFVVLMMLSSVVYYFEKGDFKVTPESPNGAYYRRAPRGHHHEISPFDSLTTAAYWALINTTSLKSSIPLSSPVSRAVSVVLAYAGVVLLALPLSIINKNFGAQYQLLNMGSEEVPEEAPLTKEEMAAPFSVGSSINPTPFFTHPTTPNVPTRPTTPRHSDVGAGQDK